MKNISFEFYVLALYTTVITAIAVDTKGLFLSVINILLLGMLTGCAIQDIFRSLTHQTTNKTNESR